MKLKRRMTYEEMARYLRKIQHCYLNDAIQDEETESPLTKGGDDGEK